MQERADTILGALETIERTLQINPDEFVYRTETFRIRCELQLKRGQIELAETDFLEGIAIAQK